MKYSPLTFIPLVLLALSTVLSPLSNTASAASKPSGSTSGPHPMLRHQPGAEASNVLGRGDLSWHNGPVEGVPTVFLIFWGPTWNDGSGGITPDGQLVENYFYDVGGSSFENILTEYFGDQIYNIPNTLTVGGVWLDFSTPPTDTSCGGPTIQDTSIQNELQQAMTTNGWPNNTNTTYFVYTPSGVAVNGTGLGCSNSATQSYCGYHNFIPTHTPTYATVIYPVIGNGCDVPLSPNNNLAGDDLINVSSHEQFETITDPQFSGWFDNAGYEIGDKCNFDFSAGLTTLNGHPYEIQTEYSNASHTCVNYYGPNSPHPHIQTYPTSLSAVSIATAPAPDQTLTIINTGPAPLNWHTYLPPPWLIVSPAFGTVASGASEAVRVSFSAYLGIGNFSTNFEIFDQTADNSPFYVPISLQVVPQPVSTVQLSPKAINLTTTAGVNPGSQTVVMTNTGQSAYSWSPWFLPDWLSLSPASGVISPGQQQPITLTFNLSDVTAQNYTTTLALVDTNANATLGLLPITILIPTLSGTWYFAEGYTGGSFSEYLTIENPNPTATIASVKYLLDQNQAPITKSYPLAAHSRTTLLVNNEIGPNHNVSMVVTAPLPIIAERPMYFTYTALPGYTIPGGTDVLGATQLNQSFDFGYIDTTAGNDPYLTFLNPNGVAMNVTIQYFKASGGTPTVIHHTFAANSRGTINVRTDEGLAPGVYSALVSLDQPGLVERPMYFKDSVTGYTGSADVVGVANPQDVWYFAEGYTNTNFSERYSIFDPDPTTAASATITFFLSNGSYTQKNFLIPAGGQVVVDANSVLGQNVNNSATVEANIPILAERFMSFDYTAAIGGNTTPSIPGATDVLGTGAPGNLFYFAEGYNGTGFAEYLTIENPDPSATAYVTVTFYPDNGNPPTVETYTIAPYSRFTLFTADVLPNAAFSMQVESNVPIVAERPMYFNYLNNGQTGGSDVVGYQP